MHGAPALPAGFAHMPYANPDAPKGGRLTWGMLGTFDSLNPFIVKGSVAFQQIRSYNFEQGYVIESLMARGDDQPFTLYGLLAKSVETDESAQLRHLPPRSRARASRTGSPFWRMMWCSPGPCCATMAGPITASIIPRWQRSRCPIPSRSGLISQGQMTGNCH